MEKFHFAKGFRERSRRLIIERQRRKDVCNSSQDSVWEHTQSLLADIQSQTQPRIVQIGGVDIVVNPKVFPPTTESRLLEEHIHTRPGEVVLDLTTGSGVAAVIAAMQGAEVLAVDINPDAVHNANENFEKHHVERHAHAVQSDLFQNVPLQQFDFIFCNPPYYDGEPKYPLEYAVLGSRKFIKELFLGMKDYLKPNGKALITFAEWSNDITFFEQTAQQQGYDIKIVGIQASSDGQRVYKLYEIKSHNERRVSEVKHE